jgi:hypothetical protein
MKTTLIHTGRTLLALYFLFPGIMKFVSWDSSGMVIRLICYFLKDGCLYFFAGSCDG